MERPAVQRPRSLLLLFLFSRASKKNGFCEVGSNLRSAWCGMCGSREQLNITRFCAATGGDQKGRRPMERTKLCYINGFSCDSFRARLLGADSMTGTTSDPFRRAKQISTGAGSCANERSEHICSLRRAMDSPRCSDTAEDLLPRAWAARRAGGPR